MGTEVAVRNGLVFLLEVGMHLDVVVVDVYFEMRVAEVDLDLDDGIPLDMV